MQRNLYVRVLFEAPVVVPRNQLTHDHNITKTDCIDDWIINRYWSNDTTNAFKSMYLDDDDNQSECRNAESTAREAMGPDRYKDFCFEVICATAYCTEFRAPFYVHAYYNILGTTIDRLRTSKKLPTCPDYPPFDVNQIPHERWNDSYPASSRQYWDQALLPWSWADSKSDAEKAVLNCYHSVSTRRSPLLLRTGIKSRDILAFISNSNTPFCRHCGARLVCDCVSSDVQRHLGSTHAVLADYKSRSHTAVDDNGCKTTGTQRLLSRKGTGCIGFTPDLCVLCNRDNNSDNLNTSFRDIYSLMHAIRFCRLEDPHLLDSVLNEEVSDHAVSARLAMYFMQIARGESTRLLRIAHESQEAELSPIDFFRPYLIRARNLFRDALSLPGIGEGWISETHLLRIVRTIFKNENVLDHVKPPWLEGLELDIYIPNRMLAFEYMGKQHYEPVEYFGGSDAFHRLVERDKRKATLCLQRGVSLIHIRYDDEITTELIKDKCQTIKGL